MSSFEPIVTVKSDDLYTKDSCIFNTKVQNTLEKQRVSLLSQERVLTLFQFLYWHATSEYEVLMNCISDNHEINFIMFI